MSLFEDTNKENINDTLEEVTAGNNDSLCSSWCDTTFVLVESESEIAATEYDSESEQTLSYLECTENLATESCEPPRKKKRIE